MISLARWPKQNKSSRNQFKYLEFLSNIIEFDRLEAFSESTSPSVSTHLMIVTTWLDQALEQLFGFRALWKQKTLIWLAAQAQSSQIHGLRNLSFFFLKKEKKICLHLKSSNQFVNISKWQIVAIYYNRSPVSGQKEKKIIKTTTKMTKTTKTAEEKPNPPSHRQLACLLISNKIKSSNKSLVIANLDPFMYLAPAATGLFPSRLDDLCCLLKTT